MFQFVVCFYRLFKVRSNGSVCKKRENFSTSRRIVIFDQDFKRIERLSTLAKKRLLGKHLEKHKHKTPRKTNFIKARPTKTMNASQFSRTIAFRLFTAPIFTKRSFDLLNFVATSAPTFSLISRML